MVDRAAKSICNNGSFIHQNFRLFNKKVFLRVNVMDKR